MSVSVRVGVRVWMECVVVCCSILNKRLLTFHVGLCSFFENVMLMACKAVDA